MLSFFRRFINSKLGIVISAVAALAIIAIGFAMTDVTGLRHNGVDRGNRPTSRYRDRRRSTITTAETGGRGPQGQYEQVTASEAQAAAAAGPRAWRQFLNLGGFDGVLQQVVGGQHARAIFAAGSRACPISRRRRSTARIASMTHRSRARSTGRFDQNAASTSIGAQLSGHDHGQQIRNRVRATRMLRRSCSSRRLTDARPQVRDVDGAALCQPAAGAADQARCWR